MTAASLARLVGQDLRRNRRQVAFAGVGVAAGVASLAFFLALGLGARGVLLGEVFPADRIEVVPPRTSLGGALGLGGARITDAVVDRLRARPEAAGVYPKMRLAFPARGWGGKSLLGRDFAFEVSGFADGIDPALVADEVAAPFSFADLEDGDGAARCRRHEDCGGEQFCAWDVNRCQEPIPALVSRHLLELYNGAIAPAHGWPRLADFVTSQFRGLTFTVELGRSYLGDRAPRGQPVQRRLRLVGISDKAIPLGVTVPLSYVRRWNGAYAGPDAAAAYSSVVVRVRDPAQVTALVAYVRSLGLDQADTRAETVGLTVTLVMALFAVVGIAIVAIAALNVAHTFLMLVAERRREIGVLRAVGARRGDVAALILAEAAAIGAGAALAGLAVAGAAAWACDLAAAAALPDFPYKPATFFSFHPGLLAGCVGFAIACCLAGAAIPARRAAALEPAAALAG